MVIDTDEESTTLSPDEAFSVLGNETRTDILQTLGESDEPLSFSELRDRVGVSDSGQFNYHLAKLEGHFIRKTSAGYIIGQPGRWVFEAVLSGAVTDVPIVSPTTVEWWACPFCGKEVEVSYHDERVHRYCTNCDGFANKSGSTGGLPAPDDRGWLGGLSLPPAGVYNRSAGDLLRAAFIWGYAQLVVAAKGVCPRCSATIEHSIEACENHDASNGFCDHCQGRHRVRFHSSCPNCRFEIVSDLSMHLGAKPELMSFMLDHGIDPLSDPWDWGWEYQEEIRSLEPFEGLFTFTIDGDSISLTVNNDLEVVGVTKG